MACDRLGRVAAAEAWSPRRRRGAGRGSGSGRRSGAADLSSGRSILIFTSRRPGRRMAGSIRSSRLEAPMTMTFFRVSTPSISASSWGTIVDSMSEEMPGAAGPEQRVHLVEEDDDGHALLALLPGPLEDQADLALGLPHVLVEQLGALDVEEVGPGRSASPDTSATFLASELATALAMRVLPQPGGPVEQDALRGRQLVLDEQLPVQERQLDGVGDGLDLAVETADVLVGDVGHLLEHQLFDLRALAGFSSSRPVRVSISMASPARSLTPARPSASSTTRSSSARPTMIARCRPRAAP